jgi:hypothetical protein
VRNRRPCRQRQAQAKVAGDEVSGVSHGELLAKFSRR